MNNKFSELVTEDLNVFQNVRMLQNSSVFSGKFETFSTEYVFRRKPPPTFPLPFKCNNWTKLESS